MILLVAETAGAILFTEIGLTRLLSVLLFYHSSDAEGLGPAGGLMWRPSRHLLRCPPTWGS
jgi:hypothetical protein